MTDHKQDFFRLYPVTFALLLVFAACDGGNNQGNENQVQTGENTELEKAPDFEVTTIGGEVVSLQQSLEEGKPTVVYFTASWCPTCAQNWPVLSEVYPEYKDRLNFVAIGIDPTDDDEVMRNLAEEKGFTFPVTRGYPDVMVDFGVESQATTVGINSEGYIEFVKNKTALDEEEFRSLFAQLTD